ncbi:hypothetical protein K438DRAFT_1771364 [Mycena galopus ATCC 62051]|nr:hypothetical protein K438DRAFT_1771364 [Mycena galopus ATCC 62051]
MSRHSLTPNPLRCVVILSVVALLSPYLFVCDLNPFLACHAMRHVHRGLAALSVLARNANYWASIKVFALLRLASPPPYHLPPQLVSRTSNFPSSSRLLQRITHRGGGRSQIAVHPERRSANAPNECEYPAMEFDACIDSNANNVPTKNRVRWCRATCKLNEEDIPTGDDLTPVKQGALKQSTVRQDVGWLWDGDAGLAGQLCFARTSIALPPLEDFLDIDTDRLRELEESTLADPEELEFDLSEIPSSLPLDDDDV